MKTGFWSGMGYGFRPGGMFPTVNSCEIFPTGQVFQERHRICYLHKALLKELGAHKVLDWRTSGVMDQDCRDWAEVTREGHSGQLKGLSHWRTGVQLPSSSISSQPQVLSLCWGWGFFCGASVSPSQEDSVESGGCELTLCATVQHKEHCAHRRASQPLTQPWKYYLLSDPRSRTMTGNVPTPGPPPLPFTGDGHGFLHRLKCSSGDFQKRVKAPLNRRRQAGIQDPMWDVPLLCSALSGDRSAAPAELIAQPWFLQPQNMRLSQPTQHRKMWGDARRGQDAVQLKKWCVSVSVLINFAK